VCVWKRNPFGKVVFLYFFSSERQNHFCKKKSFLHKTFILFNQATENKIIFARK
jgi:hypothetical protein